MHDHGQSSTPAHGRPHRREPLVARQNNRSDAFYTKARLGELEDMVHSLQYRSYRQSVWLRRAIVAGVLLLGLAGIGGFIVGQKLHEKEANAAKAQEAEKQAVDATAAVTTPATPEKPGISLLPSADPTILKLQKAAATGDLKAQYALAQRYEKGQGVPVDKPTAQGLLQNAAAGGHVAAMFELAQSYIDGRFGSPDRRAAARWFEAAATTGHAQAALALGKLYEDGLDGAPDTALALGWYQRAAGYGSNEALTAITRLAPKKPPITPDDIREMQLALRQLGFDIGFPDGKLGRRTVEAIKAYQSQIGMMSDGRPSHFLLERLAQDSVAQGG